MFLSNHTCLILGKHAEVSQSNIIAAHWKRWKTNVEIKTQIPQKQKLGHRLDHSCPVPAWNVYFAAGPILDFNCTALEILFLEAEGPMSEDAHSHFSSKKVKHP